MQALVFIEAHGKAKAWHMIANNLGMKVDVVATGGHVCRFPGTLFPIGINLNPGQPLDVTRRASGEMKERISKALSKHPEHVKIIIASDDDVEGDVIAFDLINAILDISPERAEYIWRLRPGALTHAGVKDSLNKAEPLLEFRDEIISAAIQGRARAVSDRWIGAAFSRQAGVPVGRVRSALLGAVALWGHDRDRQRPETGEVLFQCRSTGGGRPFLSRIGIDGREDLEKLQRLRDLAARFKGRMVPGRVTELRPAGAMIAPRYGAVRPFNTGGALVHAARHHAISPKDGMRGLQEAYLRGWISYPRTDSVTLSRESSGRLATLATAVGLPGINLEYLMENAEPHPGGHEALHPTPGVAQSDIEQTKRLVRRPILPTRIEHDIEELAQIMAALVTRRAFEAGRPITLERGVWHPDNSGAPLSPEDIALLQDLEWERENSGGLPWGRELMTGERQWPTASVLLEGMMLERIGRPSTYAAHIEVLEESGEIDPGEFPALPHPSPRGFLTLKKTPRRIWDPKTCRMIEDCMANAGNVLEEDTKAPLIARARHRVLAWFKQMPDDMQEILLLALEDGKGAQGPGAGAPAMNASDVEDAPLPEPSPFTGGLM